MNRNLNAVLEGNQRIVVRNLPFNELLSEECEVKINTAAICSSDIARSYGGGAYFYPLVMGHELSGEITRVGVDAKDEFSINDRVCIFPLLPCFNCSACAKNRYALCHDYDYYGSRRNGGFAEKINVKKWNLLKLPDSVSLEDGALVEPTAVVVHAISKLRIDPIKKNNVCLLGGGFLSLIAVQILNRFYPKCEVFLVDRNQFKLDIGSEYGATSRWVGNKVSWGAFLSEYEAGFDNVIEFAGSPQTFLAAIRIGSQGARIVWGGNICGDLTQPKALVSSMLRKELTIHGTWNSIYKGDNVCDWDKSLELISKGLKPSKLVSFKIGLEELDATLSKLYAHKMRKSQLDVIKVLVKPNGMKC